MRRFFTVSALMALIALVLSIATGHVATPLGATPTLRGLPIDPLSFLAGAAVAFAASWLSTLPWRDLLAILASVFRVWRRNAAFAVLALVSVGVLLLY